ncbi:MAG: hypothetical protein F6K37_38970 [Moorea sp. SIO4E2]|nr:hypothetical protein [Moorena sp. SIO4E2]
MAWVTVFDTPRPVRVAEAVGHKARGFLDQRTAVNLRVPLLDAAKNWTILNQKPVRRPSFQSIHERPRGQFSLGVKVLYLGSALKSPLLPFSLSFGVPHRTFSFLKMCSSRFTHQLLIDDWVFKEDFPYPPGISSLRSSSGGSLSRLRQGQRPRYANGFAACTHI